MEHATIKYLGYKIPLIWVKPESVLEECECCHLKLAVVDVKLGETGQVLCGKCRGQPTSNP